MSSRLDSHAKTLATLVQVPDLPAPVRDSTGSWFEPFAWYDHATRSWRTWQRSLVEEWAPLLGDLAEIGLCGMALHTGECRWCPSPKRSIWIVADPAGTDDSICAVGTVEDREHRSNLEDFVACFEDSTKEHGSLSLNPVWCEWSWIPARAHRLRALGNAVVPQIPELISATPSSHPNSGRPHDRAAASPAT